MKTDDLKQRADDLLAKMKPGKLEDNKAIVAGLEELYQQSLNEEIALSYAKGLVNLTVEQDLSGRESSVSKLEEVYKEFPDNSEIALVYAGGLFNLTIKQDLSGRESSVSKLEEVYREFSDNSTIALEYAKGLVNLSTEQDLSGLESSVSKLEQVYSSFSDNEAIALRYARGLFNLTIKQDLSDLESSVSKLEKVYKEFPDNSEIALAYADGLFNLTIEQDLSGRESSVSKLEKVYKEFPDNSEIALAYADGLFSLTIEQDLLGLESSVSKLEQVYSSFSTNEEIALAYAKGLFNFHLAKKSIDDYISENEKLISEFPSMAPILEAHKVRFLIINYANSNSLDFVKKELKTSIRQVGSRVIQEYEQIFGSNLFVDVMDTVFYQNFDRKLISFCLESFAHNLEGTQYEIFIGEDFKKFNDEQQEKLYALQKNVKEMLQALTFTDFDKKIGHYTSVETLKNLLTTNHQDSKEKDKIDKVLETLKELQTTSDVGSKKRVTENNKLEPVRIIGKSRFSNANYMNDTEEGEVLDKKLGWKRDKETIKASKWYLMSLTANVDDLSMWAQYGEKGEGVALVLNRRTFSSPSRITDHQLLKNDLSIDAEQEQKEEKSNDIPYRICYLDGEDKAVGELFSSEELDKIKELLKEMEKCLNSIEKLSEEKSSGVDDFAGRILEEIRYLFKSADYKYENEIRLLRYVPYAAINQIKQYGDFPPRLYIEADYPIKIDEIIFGPKVSEVSNYVPYIKWCDEKIKVRQSQIHFR